jgi:hypothetical protein
MEKNKFLFKTAFKAVTAFKTVGLLALVLTLGFAACKGDEEAGGGGSTPIDTDLLGQWIRGSGDTVIFDFKDGGALTLAGIVDTYSWSASGGTLTIYAAGQVMGTADYTFSDAKTKFTLSNCTSAMSTLGGEYSKKAN